MSVPTEEAIHDGGGGNMHFERRRDSTDRANNSPIHPQGRAVCRGCQAAANIDDHRRHLLGGSETLQQSGRAHGGEEFALHRGRVDAFLFGALGDE